MREGRPQHVFQSGSFELAVRPAVAGGKEAIATARCIEGIVVAVGTTNGAGAAIVILLKTGADAGGKRLIFL
jgi:hypothetical protein